MFVFLGLTIACVVGVLRKVKCDCSCQYAAKVIGKVVAFYLGDETPRYTVKCAVVNSDVADKIRVSYNHDDRDVVSQIIKVPTRGRVALIEPQIPVTAKSICVCVDDNVCKSIPANRADADWWHRAIFAIASQ